MWFSHLEWALRKSFSISSLALPLFLHLASCSSKICRLKNTRSQFCHLHNLPVICFLLFSSLLFFFVNDFHLRHRSLFCCLHLFTFTGTLANLTFCAGKLSFLLAVQAVWKSLVPLLLRTESLLCHQSCVLFVSVHSVFIIGYFIFFPPATTHPSICPSKQSIHPSIAWGQKRKSSSTVQYMVSMLFMHFPIHSCFCSSSPPFTSSVCFIHLSHSLTSPSYWPVTLWWPLHPVGHFIWIVPFNSLEMENLPGVHPESGASVPDTSHGSGPGPVCCGETNPDTKM